MVPRRPRRLRRRAGRLRRARRAHCTVCLAGNHDLGVVGVLSLEDFSRGARIAAEWTRETISEETREFLLALTPSAEAHGYGLFHASPRDPVWEYVLSGLTAELCFDADGLPGLLHRPLARRAVLPPPAGAADHRLDPPRGRRARPHRGRLAAQPGRRRPAPRRRPARRLADARHRRATRRAGSGTEYDIAAAQAAIRAARLPDSLAERLAVRTVTFGAGWGS